MQIIRIIAKKVEFVFITKSLSLFKALFLEMIHNNKKVIVSVIYHSPSQNNCELDSFLTNFDHLLSEINKQKPSLAVFTGGFNAKSTAT